MRTISVEVVLALPGHQHLRRVALPESATVADAVRASGFPAEFPQLDAFRVGIYGRRVAPDAGLRDGDRVEIYRPLRRGAREIRAQRANRSGAKS